MVCTHWCVTRKHRAPYRRIQFPILKVKMTRFIDNHTSNSRTSLSALVLQVWKIRCIHILIFFGSMWNFRRLPLQHLFIFCWKPWLEQIRYWQGSSHAWNFLVTACSLIMASKSSAILPITFESPIKAYAPESAVSSFPWTAWTPGTDRAKHKNNISAQL